MEINFLADQTTELYNQVMDEHPVQSEEQIAALLEEFNAPGWSELAKLLKTWGVPYWGWPRFQDIYRDMVKTERTQAAQRVKELPTHRVRLGEKSEVSTMVKLGDCIEAVQKEP
jgi:hypothetical protein